MEHHFIGVENGLMLSSAYQKDGPEQLPKDRRLLGTLQAWSTEFYGELSLHISCRRLSAEEFR